MFWCEMCVHIIETRDNNTRDEGQQRKRISVVQQERQCMAERNREENGIKGENREQSRRHKEESLWLLVIQRGQTDGANGERKRDSNCEKGSWRNREWGVGRQRQDRQKGHRAWKGYVCAETRKVEHIKQVWHRKVVWCHIPKVASQPFLGSWNGKVEKQCNWLQLLTYSWFWQAGTSCKKNATSSTCTTPLHITLSHEGKKYIYLIVVTC